MQYGIKILNVKGFHVFSTETIIKIESADIVEKGFYGLTMTTWHDIGMNIEKKVVNDSEFFKKYNALYLVFSEDDETFQCLKLEQVNVIDKGRHEVCFNLIVDSNTTEHDQRVSAYLVRKEEKRIERERLDQLEDKLIEQFKEELNRDE